MTEENEVAIVPQTRTKKELELIKNARELLTLLEDDKKHSANEIYFVLSKISKVLGPSINLIPTDMKKLLGVAYACAYTETEIDAKASYTRSALSALRAAILISHGPQKQINDTDYYIKIIGEEMKRIGVAGEEATLDNLWIITNRAIDYITLVIFRHGYAEINSKGFNFTKKEEPIKETK